jgi:hypothetical protein
MADEMALLGAPEKYKHVKVTNNLVINSIPYYSTPWQVKTFQG